MITNNRWLCLILGLAAAVPLAAHECWLWPESFMVTPGANVRVGLRVGEDFAGDVRPFSAARTAALRHYAAAGTRDLRARVPGAPGTDSLALVLEKPGSHLLAYDSQPSTITLLPDKFSAYLAQDGLEPVAIARHATGQDRAPGREQYRRFVKMLLLAGDASDATFASRVGQRLEIVPTTDPLSVPAGRRQGFLILFEGRPLAHALVRAWHHAGPRLIVLKERTGPDGTVAFALDRPGPWMISLVHMIPLTGVPDRDWESSWASLTFDRPAIH